MSWREQTCFFVAQKRVVFVDERGKLLTDVGAVGESVDCQVDVDQIVQVVGGRVDDAHELKALEEVFGESGHAAIHITTKLRRGQRRRRRRRSRSASGRAGRLSVVVGEARVEARQAGEARSVHVVAVAHLDKIELLVVDENLLLTLHYLTEYLGQLAHALAGQSVQVKKDEPVAGRDECLAHVVERLFARRRCAQEQVRLVAEEST